MNLAVPDMVTNSSKNPVLMSVRKSEMYQRRVTNSNVDRGSNWGKCGKGQVERQLPITAGQEVPKT